MTKILFVCLGNQCRSPMAEYIVKDYADELMMDKELYVESAGTLAGITGNEVFISAKEVLENHYINCNGHKARRIIREDYEKFDYIVCMDRGNIEAVKEITGGDPQNKICLLMSFPDDTGDDIPDPMVTNDYEQAYDDIHFGCRGLLWKIMTKDEPETDRIYGSHNADIDYLTSLFLKQWDSNEE